jgi:hypothetical protein
MSLYKINRSRSLSFVGKFKFDYTVEFNGSTVRWTQFGSPRGAYVDFRRGLEFTGLCVVSNNSADSGGYVTHPFGQKADFGKPAPDIGGNYEVRLNYFLKGGLTSERRYFTLSIQPPPNSNDELLNDPDDELAGGFTSLRRIVRGSIEGFIFDNEPLDEYVEVSEYYPSEVQTRPGNCPGSLDEFWVDKKLDQNTVRQWPKYTSLRWFETPNPKGKRTLGIYVKHQSGNKTTTHFASYDASSSLFTEYNQYKAFNAWSGDTTGTWTTDNSEGLGVFWWLMGGSNFDTSSVSTWVSGNTTKFSNQVNWADTVGATFQITGVQLEKGSAATAFENRQYGQELALCQRYYEKSYEVTTAPGTITATGAINNYGTSDGTNNQVTTRPFAVTKRTSPTMTFYTQGGTSGSWEFYRSGGNGTAAMTNYYAGTTSWAGYLSVGASWVACYMYGQWTASAEL